TAVATYTRSSQTTGEAWPRPGTAAVHATFSRDSTSQRVGSANPRWTPEARGPRNCGQLESVEGSASAAPPDTSATDAIDSARSDFMAGKLTRPSKPGCTHPSKRNSVMTGRSRMLRGMAPPLRMDRDSPSLRLTRARARASSTTDVLPADCTG